MKTQNFAAVAITTALFLTAVTLAVWQSGNSPPFAPTANTAGPAPAESHATRVAVQRPSAAVQTDEPDPPVPPTIDERCRNGFTIERDATGNFLGWLCNPSAYTDYSTAALETLAYGDSEAALILAHRLRHSDYPRAILLAQRSTALSGGDTQALLAAATWRPLAHQNGDVDLSGYGQAYVMHQLIERLKDSDYRAPPTYEIRIRELTDEPNIVFEKLDAVVDHMYDEIRRIELDITGQSTIGGNDDA